MKTIPSFVVQAIRDLARIADEGNLSDLQFAFHAECRARGGLPHPNERAKEVCHLNSGEVAKAKDIARVASFMLGISQHDCEQIARDLLVADPWTKAALTLIGEYRGRFSRLPTPEDDANWNPVNGGPATERQIALARANGTQKPARRRAW